MLISGNYIRKEKTISTNGCIKQKKTLSKKYSTLQTSPADPVVCFSHLKMNVKQKEETNYEKENRGTRSRNST